MAALPDSQDVTLAFADSDLFQCWKKKVKQGRECSLLLEHTNGKVTTTFKVSKDVKSDVKAPKTDSKSLAEKKKQPMGREEASQTVGLPQEPCGRQRTSPKQPHGSACC